MDNQKIPSKETAELNIGKSVHLKISTRQILLMTFSVFLIFFVFFMNSFPTYMRNVYGNQSISYTSATIFVYSPVAFMWIILITLIVSYFMTK